MLPIPPGVHWREVRAVELPGAEKPKQLTDVARASRPRLAAKKNAGETPAPRNGPGPGKVGILVGGRIKYVDRPGGAGYVVEKQVKPARKRVEKAAPTKYQKKHLAAARELRDRYLEHVNSREDAGVLLLRGKYDVSRRLEGNSVLPTPAATRLLPERSAAA